MKNAYPREKFLVAMDSLVSARGIKERLSNAYSSFHPVTEKHFSDPELAKQYSEIYRRMTAVETGPAGKGRVQNTIDAMTEEEAEEVTRLIWNLAHDLLTE